VGRAALRELVHVKRDGAPDGGPGVAAADRGDALGQKPRHRPASADADTTVHFGFDDIATGYVLSGANPDDCRRVDKWSSVFTSWAALAAKPSRSLPRSASAIGPLRAGTRATDEGRARLYAYGDPKGDLTARCWSTQEGHASCRMALECDQAVDGLPNGCD
jgi:hypothetical protein